MSKLNCKKKKLSGHTTTSNGLGNGPKIIDETSDADIEREMSEITEEMMAEWQRQNEVDEAVAATCQAICRSPQDVQFDLLLATGICNGLNGFRVARDLKENKNLWDGFTIGRYDDAPALPLRDLKTGRWNADTLLILAKDHAPPALEDGFVNSIDPIYNQDELNELWELAAGWGPAELEWVPFNQASKMLGASYNYKLLRVWWD